MLDFVRSSLHRVLTSPAGDRFRPVRISKDLALSINGVCGEPVCSREELERRRAARAHLDELRKNGAPTAPVARAQAPVMVYFEKDRNVRLLGRIQELLDAKSIRYTLLDVAGDEATRDFVVRTAQCEEDDLPVVFVAGTVVGGFNALTEFDVSGRLAKAL